MSDDLKNQNITGNPTSPTSQGSSGEPGTPMSAQRSCLSGANKDGPPRTDAGGKIIEKGKKSHKIAFIDQLQPGSSIHKVKEVESFKNGSKGKCACTIM